MTLKKKTFEFIVGKGENAGNHLLLTNAFNSDQCKTLSFGKGLTLYLTTSIRLFKTERVRRQKFYENSRKFSKWVKNIVGKGEIACYEQVLLFPQCFQKILYRDT